MAILIVDDSADVRLLLSSLISKAGFSDVTTVHSAEDCFSHLNGRGKLKGLPDLILMDIGLPRIDGITACGQIKADPNLRDIPVLFIATQIDLERLEQSADTGAMDFIVKPIRKFELLTRVRSALALKREMESRRARERELIEMKKQTEELNTALEQLSTLDELTGVQNRRSFNQILAAEWRRASRINLPLSLLIIDVDFFKIFNDTCGHPRADECLRQIAQSLATTLIRTGDHLSRYGGEEFAVILPATDLDGTRTVAERLRNSVEALHLAHPGIGKDATVTVSIGGATTVPRSNPSDLELLVSAADQALYQAKQRGRNRVELQPIRL